MVSEQSIRRLCCYAVLKNGYTGDNYLLPHMRLVLCLLSKKKYASINIDKLVSDFEADYQYSISYFAMKKILGLAAKNGYLGKKHNRKDFSTTDRIKEYEGGRSRNCLHRKRY